jgi:hypothetical protein
MLWKTFEINQNQNQHISKPNEHCQNEQKRNDTSIIFLFYFCGFPCVALCMICGACYLKMKMGIMGSYIF